MSASNRLTSKLAAAAAMVAMATLSLPAEAGDRGTACASAACATKVLRAGFTLDESKLRPSAGVAKDDARRVPSGRPQQTQPDYERELWRHQGVG